MCLQSTTAERRRRVGWIQMINETPVYQWHDITVTTERVVVGEEVIPVASIVSASLGTSTIIPPLAQGCLGAFCPARGGGLRDHGVYRFPGRTGTGCRVAGVGRLIRFASFRRGEVRR